MPPKSLQRNDLACCQRSLPARSSKDRGITTGKNNHLFTTSFAVLYRISVARRLLGTWHGDFPATGEATGGLPLRAITGVWDQNLHFFKGTKPQAANSLNGALWGGAPQTRTFRCTTTGCQ